MTPNERNEPSMPDVSDPSHYTAPLTDNTPTRPSSGPSAARQPDGAAAPGRAIASAPSPSAAVASTVKVRRPSPFSPRLGLLAALLYNPVVLVAYLLYLYGPVNTCVAGSLCSFGSYPAVVQALLILAGSATLWLLLYALVLRAIEAPGRKTGLVRLLRDLARYERIHELLLVYGALLALLLMVALVTRRLTLPSFIVGAFGLFVCLYCANSTPAETQTPAVERGGKGPPP